MTIAYGLFSRILHASKDFFSHFLREIAFITTIQAHLTVLGVPSWSKKRFYKREMFAKKFELDFTFNPILAINANILGQWDEIEKGNIDGRIMIHLS